MSMFYGKMLDFFDFFWFFFDFENVTKSYQFGITQFLFFQILTILIIVDQKSPISEDPISQPEKNFLSSGT